MKYKNTVTNEVVDTRRGVLHNGKLVINPTNEQMTSWGYTSLDDSPVNQETPLYVEATYDPDYPNNPLQITKGITFNQAYNALTNENREVVVKVLDYFDDNFEISCNLHHQLTEEDVISGTTTIMHSSGLRQFVVQWTADDGLNISEIKKADLIGGKVPASQLPSYVDDVIEGTMQNNTFTPSVSGTNVQEEGKIYVDTTTNKVYRWSGSTYVEISATPTVDNAPTSGSGNLITSGAVYTGLSGKQNSTSHIVVSTIPDQEEEDEPIANTDILNSITSIVTNESSEAGGTSTITITETNGTTTVLQVKNGTDGVNLGDVTLVQTTGNATDSVMSQKAVSDELCFEDKVLTDSDFTNWIVGKSFYQGALIDNSNGAVNLTFIDIREYNTVAAVGGSSASFTVTLYDVNGYYIADVRFSGNSVVITRATYPKMCYFRIWGSATTYDTAFTITLSSGNSLKTDIIVNNRNNVNVLHTAFKCNIAKSVKVYEGNRMTNKTIVIFANCSDSYTSLMDGTILASYGQGWCIFYLNGVAGTQLCRFSQAPSQTKPTVSMILTFDDTGNMKVYLNGVLKTTCAYSDLPDTNWKLYLGEQYMSHFSIINCALDDYIQVIENNGWVNWLPDIVWTEPTATITATNTKGGWMGLGYRKNALVKAHIRCYNNTSSSIVYQPTNLYKYPPGNVTVEANSEETFDCLLGMKQQCSFGVLGSPNQANIGAEASGYYVVFEWGMDYRYCRNGGHYNLSGLEWEATPSVGLAYHEMLKAVVGPAHTYADTGCAVGQISVDSNGNLQMFNGTVWKQINNS